jgi:hypothetical protein
MPIISTWCQWNVLLHTQVLAKNDWQTNTRCPPTFMWLIKKLDWRNLQRPMFLTPGHIDLVYRVLLSNMMENHQRFNLWASSRLVDEDHLATSVGRPPQTKPPLVPFFGHCVITRLNEPRQYLSRMAHPSLSFAYSIIILANNVTR